MSKDKGSKNHKKAPAVKTKDKPISAYKSEGKSASPTLPIFVSKPDAKTDKPPKA
jgi:hypothetical protein